MRLGAWTVLLAITGNTQGDGRDCARPPGPYRCCARRPARRRLRIRRVNLTADVFRSAVTRAVLAFAGLEGGVGAGVDDVAVEEEVAEHGAGLAEFDMTVEGMRYALDGVEFGGNTCGAEFVEEVGAGFEGDGDVFGAVEEDGGGPGGRDVGVGAGSGTERCYIGFWVGFWGEGVLGGEVDGGVVGEAGGDFGTDAFVAAVAFEFGVVRCTRDYE